MGYLLPGILGNVVLAIGGLIALRAIRAREYERVIHQIYQGHVKQKRAHHQKTVLAARGDT
jgi:hypothetical protein